MRSRQEVKNIVSELYAGLAPLFPHGNMEAILFGSYARGDADGGSDIDVMILVDSPRSEISSKSRSVGDVAADILLNHGVMVSPIVENREYFQNNAGVLPLYRNIVSEGVRLNA